MKKYYSYLVIFVSVIASTPSKAQWQTIYNDPTPNQPMTRISAPNKDTAYIFGNSMSGPHIGIPCIAMHRTTDGGNTWNLSYLLYAGPDTLGQIHAARFINGHVGYAIVDAPHFGNCIIKTTDAGSNWAVCFVQSGGLIPSGKIFFLNADTGYVNTQNGQVLKTLDGGATWVNYNTLSAGVSQEINEDVWFLSSSVGFILNASTSPSPSSPSMIQRTTDGGQTWTNVQSDITHNYRQIFFTSASVGYVVADSFPGGQGRAKFLYTTNGGLNWNVKSYIPNFYCANVDPVSFVSDSVGYLCGSDNTGSSPALLRTMDAGLTWNAMVYPDGNGGYFPSIAFADHNTGYTLNQNSIYPNAVYKLVITDSVWPGDCNSDLIADNTDLLNIGLDFNATGIVRNGASNSWNGQFSKDWSHFNSTANSKHSDCDGNGVVNMNDTLAIALNYGSVHTLRVSPYPVLTSNPDMFFQFDKNLYYPGDTLLASLMIGDASNPQNNYYGSSFHITYNMSQVKASSEQFYFNNSWAGNINQSVIRFAKVGSGAVDAALVRTTHTDTSGYGKVATLRLILKDTLHSNHFPLTILNSVKIDHRGVYSGMNSGTDSATIFQTAGMGQSGHRTTIILFPNPASDVVHLELNNAEGDFLVCNCFGEVVMQGMFNQKKFDLDVADLVPGMYVLKIQGVVTKFMKN